MIKARIFNIERFAITDGPGIRTVVFMQGCPFHCPWCSNPESQSAEGGSLREVADILDEVERDKDYYDASGGGITFSGGEPLMQPSALEELLRGSRERGFHTAVETTAVAPEESLRRMLPYVDLWLVDLKHTDALSLKDATGADGEIYEKNLEWLDPGRVVLRRPCIPGFNMDPEQIEASFRLAMRMGIKRMDLIPFHTLGAEKYRRMGRAYPYGAYPAMHKSDLEPYRTLGVSLGIDTRII